MNRKAAFVIAVTAIACLLSSGIIEAVAPIQPNDLVGRWRSVQDKTRVITLSLAPAGDALQTPGPCYTRCKPNYDDYLKERQRQDDLFLKYVAASRAGNAADAANFLDFYKIARKATQQSWLDYQDCERRFCKLPPPGSAPTPGPQSNLSLVSVKYSDWQPMSITRGATVDQIFFDRKMTKEDIQKMRLDNSAYPPPNAVVSDASGIVSERFVGSPKRLSHIIGSECDLTMSVIWNGVHIQWNEDASPNSAGKIWWYKNPQPKAKEDFAQIRYAWPDLKKSVVNTLYNGRSAATGTEIDAYFRERPAMQVYGEFGAALFKPIFGAVTEAVPAETFLGKVAQKLFGTAVEKSLQDDLKAKDFVSVIAGQVFDKVLDSVNDREPFATIQSKLDAVIDADKSEITRNLVDKGTGMAKDKGADLAGDRLTKDEVTQLDTYLQNQCRYQLGELKSYGVVTGGITVVDTLMGTATVWLFLRGHGTEPATAVIGTTSVPEQGTLHVMNIQFSPIQ